MATATQRAEVGAEEARLEGRGRAGEAAEAARNVATGRDEPGVGGFNNGVRNNGVVNDGVGPINEGVPVGDRGLLNRNRDGVGPFNEGVPVGEGLPAGDRGLVNRNREGVRSLGASGPRDGGVLGNVEEEFARLRTKTRITAEGDAYCPNPNLRDLVNISKPLQNSKFLTQTGNKWVTSCRLCRFYSYTFVGLIESGFLRKPSWRDVCAIFAAEGVRDASASHPALPGDADGGEDGLHKGDRARRSRDHRATHTRDTRRRGADRPRAGGAAGAEDADGDRVPDRGGGAGGCGHGAGGRVHRRAPHRARPARDHGRHRRTCYRARRPGGPCHAHGGGPDRQLLRGASRPVHQPRRLRSPARPPQPHRRRRWRWHPWRDPAPQQQVRRFGVKLRRRRSHRRR